MAATPGERSIRISRRVLDSYLLDEEIPIVATRQHWARLVEPLGTTFVALLFITALSTHVRQEGGDGTWVFWAVWFVLFVRSVWHLVQWRSEWFVATDRRMLLVYGVITHKVAMMPLAKVTDMNYGRSLLGRMLGYGQFVLESAGQEQAMREISWVPDPDEKYRRICSTIFGQDPDGEASRRAWDAYDEEVGSDPFETTFDDDSRSFTDRFDADLVRVSPGRGGRRHVWWPGASDVQQDRRRERQERRERDQRDDRWEPVERHELPADWTWTDEVAREAREATRRRVAVDPDPTPPQGY